jgi:hypothetical protein
MMWRNCHEEKDPYKRNQILKDILSTKDVMRESAFMKRYYNAEFETDKIVSRHEYNKLVELSKDKEN